MMIGLAFALLVTLCGISVQRGLRLPLSLAPLSGLAAVAVLSSWIAVLRLPPLVSSGAVLLLAATGVVLTVRARPGVRDYFYACRPPVLLLAAGAILPALVLGSVFAGVEAPVSVHDGAFHVETIERLRQAGALDSWYPMGFHTSVVALLTLVPWLDSARGTAEAAQGLAILASLGVFGLALAFTSLAGSGAGGRGPARDKRIPTSGDVRRRKHTLIAALAAVVLALTWTYPYDYHLWGGWPQGMGVLLLMGLWAAALHWIRQPSLGWAVAGAGFASSIVLSHGTEVYSAVLGLLVIVLARGRWIDLRRALQHVPLALGLSIVLIGPYLLTILGWASAGGALKVAADVADFSAANPDAMGKGDWLQFAFGASGGASFIDLPARIALIGLGLRLPALRLATALWLTFLALLLAVDFFDLAPMRTLFVMTYPWLVDHRPRQIAVVLASVLAAGGLSVVIGHLTALRDRLATRRNAWRRLAIACALVAGFFAEGSAVSVYKRMSQAIAEQDVFSADDRAAMTWLRQNARPGEVLANDGSRDAGIWAPYKASIPILMLRSDKGTAVAAERTPILEHITDLAADPSARKKTCSLNVDYLYVGARPMPADEPLLPDRATLERAPDLQEVFTSGDAAIFRINASCP